MVQSTKYCCMTTGFIKIYWPVITQGLVHWNSIIALYRVRIWNNGIGHILTIHLWWPCYRKYSTPKQLKMQGVGSTMVTHTIKIHRADEIYCQAGTTARLDENHLSFGICHVLYYRFYDTLYWTIIFTENNIRKWNWILKKKNRIKSIV